MPALGLLQEALSLHAAHHPADLNPAEVTDLILTNLGGARRLAWSFLNRWRARMEQDEVNSVTGAALCEAANRFNSKLGVEFRTFFFYYLRGMLLKEIARRINEQRLALPAEFSAEAARRMPLSEWPYRNVEHVTPEDALARREMLELCFDAYSDLDTLERRVLEMFFLEEKTVVGIARELGYCRCHISRVKSRALGRLKRSVGRIVGATSKRQRGLHIQKYRGSRGRRYNSKSTAAQG